MKKIVGVVILCAVLYSVRSYVVASNKSPESTGAVQSDSTQILATLKGLALSKTTREDAIEFLHVATKLEADIKKLAEDKDIQKLPTRAQYHIAAQSKEALMQATKEEIAAYNAAQTNMSTVLSKLNQARTEVNAAKKDSLYEEVLDELHSVAEGLLRLFNKTKNGVFKAQVKEHLNQVQQVKESVLAEVFKNDKK